MPFVVLDADANPDSKIIAHDDLEAHMIATGRFGAVDFAFAYIGDLNLENYAGTDAENAVVLVVVEKVPGVGDEADGDDNDDNAGDGDDESDDEDDVDSQPLTVLGFIFVEGRTNYDFDGVWKDALYFGRLADELDAEEDD